MNPINSNRVGMKVSIAAALLWVGAAALIAADYGAAVIKPAALGLSLSALAFVCFRVGEARSRR